MRILKLKTGEELEVSDKLFQTIEPYIKSGKKGEFKVRGRKYKIWDIENFSDPLDDSLFSRVESGSQYVSKNTPKKYKAEKYDEWEKSQIRKLDIMAIPDKLKKSAVKILKDYYPIREGAGMAYLKAVITEVRSKKQRNNLFV